MSNYEELYESAIARLCEHTHESFEECDRRVREGRRQVNAYLANLKVRRG